jgi:hypothetical protein
METSGGFAIEIDEDSREENMTSKQTKNNPTTNTFKKNTYDIAGDSDGDGDEDYSNDDQSASVVSHSKTTKSNNKSVISQVKSKATDSKYHT